MVQMSYAILGHEGSKFLTQGPLSVTTVCSNPRVAKTDLRTSIVFEDVIEFITYASNHLEWASDITKNMCPI